VFYVSQISDFLGVFFGFFDKGRQENMTKKEKTKINNILFDVRDIGSDLELGEWDLYESSEELLSVLYDIKKDYFRIARRLSEIIEENEQAQKEEREGAF
jgi:hypothetical protein